MPITLPYDSKSGRIEYLGRWYQGSEGLREALKGIRARVRIVPSGIALAPFREGPRPTIVLKYASPLKHVIRLAGATKGSERPPDALGWLLIRVVYEDEGDERFEPIGIQRGDDCVVTYLPSQVNERICYWAAWQYPDTAGEGDLPYSEPVPAVVGQVPGAGAAMPDLDSAESRSAIHYQKQT
ncbi:MAG TPA: hypothetical protein VGM37_02000 [Armatimonadota bacterium]|jgi:hypothetical protein